MFQRMGMEVFTALEQSYKCYDSKSFLRILANFASGQSIPALPGRLNQDALDIP